MCTTATFTTVKGCFATIDKCTSGDIMCGFFLLKIWLFEKFGFKKKYWLFYKNNFFWKCLDIFDLFWIFLVIFGFFEKISCSLHKKTCREQNLFRPYIMGPLGLTTVTPYRAEHHCLFSAILAPPQLKCSLRGPVGDSRRRFIVTHIPVAVLLDSSRQFRVSTSDF
jgi:hypothetical protein